MYACDRGGNLLTKKAYPYTTGGTLGTVQQTIAYTYGDSTWKDKLTAYNGTTLSYDAIGNLTNDGTWAHTWICGRQLRRMYDGTTDIYYGYDHNGLRVSKNVNGTVTNYTTTNGKLTHMKRGSEYMHIFYDGQGRASLFNKNGVKYTYVYNLQGDVVGLLDESGVLVVEYKYDAWGKLLGTTGSLASTIGKFNPLRYRGYVYDEETGLYYLKSRYYNPEWGRFVNADVLLGKRGALLSHNLFTYCGNNSVNRKDPTGQFGIAALIAATVVVACTVALSGCSVQSSPPADYVQENSIEQNCYSYAFGLPHSANPGDYSISGNSDYMFKDKNIYTPKEITEFILRDMEALNKSVRVVGAPEDKFDNEYIVAMKTSTTVVPSIGVADYHFAVQLADGTWADKTGQRPSRWNVLDGTAIAWDLGYIKNYYDTESVYFAVER